jgi:ABC-2 type transport system ATP-binding protein
VKGVRAADIHGAFAEVSYEGSVNAVLQAAMTHEVVNLHSRDADLEEIFLAYYRDPDDDDDPQGHTRQAASSAGKDSSHGR